MIEQASRRRDQHINATRNFDILIAERHATDQQRHIEPLADTVFVEAFFNLRRQFAGWLQDQGARHPGARAALFKQRHHRQGEGRRFTGAGLRNAKHIAARKNFGDRLCLNGRRLGVAGRCHRIEHFLAQSKFRKVHGSNGPFGGEGESERLIP